MKKMIQLRHVPDAVHRQLKARAALAGMSLSEFLVREVRKIAECPTPEEMQERLKARERYTGRLRSRDGSDETRRDQMTRVPPRCR